MVKQAVAHVFCKCLRAADGADAVDVKTAPGQGRGQRDGRRRVQKQRADGLARDQSLYGRQKNGGQVKRRVADDGVHRKPQYLRRYRIEYRVQNRAEQRRDEQPPALFRKRPQHARSCNLSMFHSMLPNISFRLSVSTQN